MLRSASKANPSSPAHICYDGAMPGKAYLDDVFEIVSLLRARKIEPVIYGSVGVSLYLGPFKRLNDVDLLIDDEWLNDRWPELQKILGDAGFGLIDEREHEFKDQTGRSPSFARKSILLRDSILSSLDELVMVGTDDKKLTTLTPKALLRAYEFSARDGYRKGVRGKKDADIIALLKAYIDRTAKIPSQ
jgi:hypothetical protein